MKPECSAIREKMFCVYLLLVYLLLNKKKSKLCEHRLSVLIP